MKYVRGSQSQFQNLYVHAFGDGYMINLKIQVQVDQTSVNCPINEWKFVWILLLSVFFLQADSELLNFSILKEPLASPCSTLVNLQFPIATFLCI